MFVRLFIAALAIFFSYPGDVTISYDRASKLSTYGFKQ
jgi:hypothetical protein